MDADETTFSALFERHCRELRAHCYQVLDVIHWDRPELFEAFGLPMGLSLPRRSNEDEVTAKEVR